MLPIKYIMNGQINEAILTLKLSDDEERKKYLKWMKNRCNLCRSPVEYLNGSEEQQKPWPHWLFG